jgi:hypothetical protein
MTMCELSGQTQFEIGVLLVCAVLLAAWAGYAFGVDRYRPICDTKGRFVKREMIDSRQAKDNGEAK